MRHVVDWAAVAEQPERIEIELIDTSGAGGRTSDWSPAAGAVVARGEPGPGPDDDNGRRRVAMLVAVAMLVGGGVGWVIGRSSNPATEEPASEETVTGETGTEEPATGETAAASGADDVAATLATLPAVESSTQETTAAVQSTTTTLAPVPVVVPVEPDVRVAGLDIELVGLRNGRLVRIDLRDRSARVVTPSSTRPILSETRVVAGDDWTLLWEIGGPEVLRLVTDDGASSDIELGVRPDFLLNPSTGMVWRARYESGGPVPDAYEAVGLDGEAVGPTIRMPPQSFAVGVDPQGGLVAYLLGRIFRVDVERREPIADGLALAAGLDRAVVGACDEQMACGLFIVDRATGERRPIELRGDDAGRLDVDAWASVFHYSPLSMAPDETAMFHDNWISGRPYVIVELESGLVTELPFSGRFWGDESLAWSPDGRFLFGLDSGRLAAYDRTTGEVFPVVPDDEPGADLASDWSALGGFTPTE